MRYTFAECVLDTDRCELYRAGALVKLEPKPYEVLVYLVQHAERLVRQEELLEHVWDGAFVQPIAIARSITAIRQAVGDSREAQRVIKTLHRHGYRFVAPLTVRDTQVLATAASQPAAGSPDLAPPLSMALCQEEVMSEPLPPAGELSHVSETLKHHYPPHTVAPQRRGSMRTRMVGPVPSVLIQHFKGRVDELRFLREQLTHEHVRLLLVCGRGGVGKTTLITKLLHDLHGDVTRHASDASAEVDSMVYVELRRSEWRSPDKIVERIGQALAPDAAAALRTKWQKQTSLVDKFEFLFRQALREWRCLIVLDNFEELLDDSNHIREEFGDLRLFVEKCLVLGHS